jgi:cyclophilin family peptidyl-prolyl cis-trans isomerase
MPTVAIGTPPVPSKAQVAASTSACAPFAKAGNKPESAKKWGAAPSLVIDKNKTYVASLYTTYGLITADILPKLGPIAANNFVFLACHGFYNGVIFHRVVPGFMIQGGDPLGTGLGGPGYTIKDDTVPRAYQIGDLAMANTGHPDTAGSQFFIMQGPQISSLGRTYPLFGHVTAGQKVVNTIAQAKARSLPGSIDSVPSSPIKPVKITRITIQVS